MFGGYNSFLGSASVCSTAQSYSKMDSDTVHLEAEKLPDSDDDHGIEDDDVIINIVDVVELDKMIASPLWGYFEIPENDDPFSSTDHSFLSTGYSHRGFWNLEDIDLPNYGLYTHKFEDESKKRDEDESGNEEAGKDEKIEEDTKGQFGNASVASKDVIRQQRKKNCDMATLDNAGCITNLRAAASETDSSPDLFSRLPDEIFNQIISLLTPKALIKTRMLARRWLALSPGVHFSIRSDAEFRESLQSLSEQEVTVKSVSIELENYSTKYGNFTRDLVSLTRKKNFSELSLRWKGSMRQMLHFDFPSLVVLRLDGCVFFRRLKSSWTLGSLQVLSFNNVWFDLEDLSTITFGCPNVSHLSLKQCWDRGRTGVVILSGLKRLKNVQVCGSCYKGIVIDSPDLFFLEYSSSEKASKIDVRHCKKLEVLKLKTKINPKLLLGKLFPGFPLLGYVNSHCSSSVSHHARSFNICADLSVEATPDVCLFKYVRSGFGEYVRSFKFSSMRNHKPKPQWKLARFKEDSVIISTCFFMDFRRLVEICEGRSIFSFRLLLTKGVDIGELRYSRVSPVRHIGHLKLKLAGAFIKIPSPYSKVLLDAFLFCCYPDTLTLKLRKNQNVFIEALREKLKQRSKKMCCKTSNVKCWRHFLEDVEFEHTTRTNKQGTEYERLDIRFQWA